MVRKMVIKKRKKELDTTPAAKKRKDKKTDPKKTKEGTKREKGKKKKNDDEGIQNEETKGKKGKRSKKKTEDKQKKDDEGTENEESAHDTTTEVEKNGANVKEKATDDANDGESSEEEKEEGVEDKETEEEEEKDEEVVAKETEEEEEKDEGLEAKETEEEEEKDEGLEAKETEEEVEKDEGVEANETQDEAVEATWDDGDRDMVDSLGKDIQTDQDAGDDEEDSRALQPEKMYFKPSDYTTSIRIATRCNVGDALAFLEQFPVEMRWLKSFEQFKHIFHLPEEPNHQVQALWMLLLRKTCTDLRKECWFLVNGRLIRYSIREHALITGFNCKEYPANWEKLGSFDFASRVFKKKRGVKISDVEKELLSRKKKNPSNDKTRLVVLYFLAKVLKAKNKHDPGVDTFLMRIVDDLGICENFPWGRYTFHDCIESIQGLVDNVSKGGVKRGGQSGFNGFIIPAEILAFECIPRLGRQFREDVGADPRCPRMCKRKFAKGDSKGLTLDELNAALGEDTDIISILEPTEDERDLLRQNVDDDVDDGLGFIDVIVESWRQCLVVEKKGIFWKYWHKKDVDGRRGASSSKMVEEEDVDVVETHDHVEKKSLKSLEAVLLDAVEKGFSELMGELRQLDTKVVEKLSALDTKVENLRCCVVGQRRVMNVTGRGGSPGTGYVMYANPYEVVSPILQTTSEVPPTDPPLDTSENVVVGKDNEAEKKDEEDNEGEQVEGEVPEEANDEEGGEKENAAEEQEGEVNEGENIEEEVFEKANDEEGGGKVQDDGKEKEKKEQEVRLKKRKDREENEKLVLPDGLKRASKPNFKFTPGESKPKMRNLAKN